MLGAISNGKKETNRTISDRFMDSKIADLRRNYTKGGLQEEQLPENPITFFKQWFDEALKSEVMEPNAMSLATVTTAGTPNSRMVLLKGIEEKSIQFYTNYNSDKGQELEENPAAAVTFWWPELERQVRIWGDVSKLSDKESSLYFQSRPRESQLGAWASNQSSDIDSRESLKKQFAKFQEKFEGKDIPKPEQWGGYEIEINKIEFWQGRPGRFHDRILYAKESGTWNRKRLQP